MEQLHPAAIPRCHRPDADAAGSPVAASQAAKRAPAPSATAVWVGDVAGLDACGASGRVIGSSMQPVFAAPRPDAAQSDRLPAGRWVWLCDAVEDRWHGIVYPADPDQDGGVSVPVARHQPYAGPCRSGWVRATDVALMAG